jgi:hypothetical protein
MIITTSSFMLIHVFMLRVLNVSSQKGISKFLIWGSFIAKIVQILI